MIAGESDDDRTAAPAAEADHHEDLGFGRVVAQQVRGRFLSRDGAPNSHKYGLGAQRAARFYQRALSARWPAFLGWTMGALLLLNGFFALAYTALGADALRGQNVLGLDDPFLRAFSFSVGVFTTTGTGPMHAYGPTAHWLVIFEMLVGPLTLVGAGGLLVARLTRPRMRLRYSESAVIAPYEGGRGLMFRIVNVQPGELSDVKVRVNLAWFEDVNGRRERDFHQLELERSSVEFFALHWTVVHPITADSPLRGITPERLHAAEAEFLVHVSAHEETFSTRVTSRTSYLSEDVRWDVKFADIFVHAADGVIAIDVDRLDRTERLPEGTTSVPAAQELGT
ncbi:MAG: ion channel [Gemmatimonadaceae bacterium]